MLLHFPEYSRLQDAMRVALQSQVGERETKWGLHFAIGATEIIIQAQFTIVTNENYQYTGGGGGGGAGVQWRLLSWLGPFQKYPFSWWF